MNKTIIIGGGVAGLTAGIYCARNGIECEIIEKNAFCGGNLGGWYREGCYIDNCIHWLTGTNSGVGLYRIWNDIGMITDSRSLYQPNVFYESVLGGESIAFSRYPEVTRLNMLRLSPVDSKEIDRFIDAVEAAGAFISKKSLSKDTVAAYARYRGITLGELSERFHHPLLKLAFTDYFGHYFSAIALVWAYGAFICGNGMVPKGGSQKAAERIENKFIENGGRIRRSCSVSRVITDGDHACGVITEKGEYIRAQAIVCACDPFVAFGKLLPLSNMPRGLSMLYRKGNAAPRFSSVQAAFRCPADKISGFGTRVVSCNMPYGAARLVIKEYGYEPGFAPQGETVLQTMLFVGLDKCEKWINLHCDGKTYQEKKATYAQCMKNAIINEFPLLNGDVRCIDVWTPATYHYYFGSDHGAYMAFALTPKTPLIRFSPHIKGLKNAFIATQWQCSPGGLPNAARSGKAAADAVIKLLKK